MPSKIKQSPILQEYHTEHLKEYKFFLNKLLNEERAQQRLIEQYAKCPETKPKKKANLKRKIKKKKKGRQRKCFDYEIAKQIVRSEAIMSITQYKRWHELNKPVRMPKNPDRAYKSVWKGWGDFLGVTNEYTRRPGSMTNGRGKYRTLEEAKQFVRSLNLKGYKDWKAYIKTGKCPMDIPHRPDIVYSSGKRKTYWLSWKDFLGYEIMNTEEKIQTVVPILYIAKKQNSTLNNVYVINVIPGGKAALIDHINKLGFRLIAAYYTNKDFNYKLTLSELTKNNYGEVDEYLLNNPFELTYELDSVLERVR
jgi:hypothetical protein